MEIGAVWNESETYTDPLTGRTVRRLTSAGRINQTPTYHTDSGFTADGRFSAFVSVRGRETWIVRAELATGDLSLLWKTEGVGDRSYIHRGMSLRWTDVDGGGICGNRLCVAPESAAAVFCVHKSIVAVDMATGEAAVLLESCGDEWIYGAPAVSPDEKYAAVTLSSSHPEMRGGRLLLAPEKPYLAYSHELRVIRVPLDGTGGVDVLYGHPDPAQSAHCAYCPADQNLLYFDLDLPPRYWTGSDGSTPRIWLLDVGTGEAKPLKKDYPGSFQTHQAWLWDGSAMCYHGPAREGGEFFGIATPTGEVLWERVFGEAKAYGHITPDARRAALIMDGTFSRDKLQWLAWDSLDSARPELEPICLHATEWGSLPGQYSHPHPLTDRSGRWISFTSARAGRSDVFVVDVSR